MKEKLKAIGVPATVRRLSAPDFLQVIQSGDYDLLGSSYILNFPDADAALDPIDSRSSVRLGRFDSSHLMAKLDKLRSNDDNTQRLAQYSEAMGNFEQENYIIPMFRLRLPMLHRSDIQVPESSFRYEAELWKILWK